MSNACFESSVPNEKSISGMNKRRRSLNRDKYNDNEIRLGIVEGLKLVQEVVFVAGNNPELLNTVYKEISEKLGMDAAISIYQMFKGQQVSFPVRLLNPAKIQQLIVEEYDGKNIRTLAIKYSYSEKTIRRIIKDSTKE